MDSLVIWIMIGLTVALLIKWEDEVPEAKCLVNIELIGEK